MYRNVQHFIRSTKVFRISPQLDILCTNAVMRYYAQNDKSLFTCNVFSRVGYRSSWKQKTCHRVVLTSVWLISYSEELCNKNCIVKTSETLII